MNEALVEQAVAEGYGNDDLVPELGPEPEWFKEGEGGKLVQPKDDSGSLKDFGPSEQIAPQAWHDDPPEGQTKEGGFWAWFPMGGWVYHGVRTRMQRVDQGQDFEVPSGHHIIAPSWGKCVAHLSDRNWPSGFGSPYAVVWIGGPCRFKGRFWYIGHNNAQVIPAGRWFHSMTVLSLPNHGLNYGWGWTELGHAPNGYPGPWGEGARWHWAFSPAKKWATY